MCVFFVFFKQKTAYEMRISDWSSDVCSSDLAPRSIHHQVQSAVHKQLVAWINDDCRAIRCDFINAVAINKQREYALRKRRVGARHPSHRIMYSLFPCPCRGLRSEEHTSELQSLMRISYAVFCLQKKTNTH